MTRIGHSVTGGKIILLGEHFVLYGASAIAIPFGAAKAKIQVEKAKEDYIVSTLYDGKLDESPQVFKGLKALIMTCKAYLGINEAVKITVESTIPLQRGMGSSAALSIGITKAMFDYVGREFEYSTIREFAEAAEGIHHANSSGVDIETILNGKPILFNRSKDPVFINTDIDADLILVDSNIHGSTKEAVNLVAKFADENPHEMSSMIEEIKEIVSLGQIYLEENNIEGLGKVFNDNHQLLKRVGVSHPKIDLWIQDALGAGAIGGKITGGGMGGCFIILSTDKEITKKLKNDYSQDGLNVMVLEMKGL